MPLLSSQALSWSPVLTPQIPGAGAGEEVEGQGPSLGLGLGYRIDCLADGTLLWERKA